MTGSKIFDTQKETIDKINDMLKASPIIAGDTIIGVLYRKHDMKPMGNSYFQIEFREVFTSHGLACSTNEIKGIIDVFSTNEIMCGRLAYLLVERLYNAKINDTEYITKCNCVDGVVKLTNNEYVQRIEFLMELM